MTNPKNVLFIIMDQLRADCLFGSLSKHVKLPNLQEFMKESVTFERHFSVVNPCGPSRASILTGQYSMNHRSIRNGTPLRHDIPNIATEARKLGYSPMLFGYTDTSKDPRFLHENDPDLKSYENPMNGFYEITEMRQDMSYPWRADLISKGYEFDCYNDVYRPVSPTGGTPLLNDPALYSAEDSDTAFLTNEFLNKITAYKGENWFAHLTYIRPHPPLVAPAPYNTMYDPASLPNPVRMETAAHEQAMHPFFPPAHERDDIARFVEGFPDLETTDENVQILRSIYFGLATEVDHHLGRIIEYLKSSGQYDDTLIVFTADHGEMLGDRHAWGKMTVYDAAYHTPLIIRDPNHTKQAGSKITEVTESIDITPTILDWLGQNAPASMDGRTLSPMLQGETPKDWRKYSYSELDFADPIVPTIWQQHLGTSQSNSNLCILRDERFTLVHFAADLPSMLFDSEGHGEMENVAAKPEMQSDLMRLTQMMLSHRMAHMDHTLSTSSVTNDGIKNAPRYM